MPQGARGGAPLQLGVAARGRPHPHEVVRERRLQRNLRGRPPERLQLLRAGDRGAQDRGVERVLEQPALHGRGQHLAVQIQGQPGRTCKVSAAISNEAHLASRAELARRSGFSESHIVKLERCEARLHVDDLAAFIRFRAQLADQPGIVAVGDEADVLAVRRSEEHTSELQSH